MFSNIRFLSSPLRPTTTPATSSIQFSTPQFKGWSIYANNHTSPLQTSRNANIMSRSHQQQQQSTTDDAENTMPKASTDPAPFFFLNPTSELSNNSETNPSTTRATKFQYESRARLSSSTAQLRSETSSRRDARKQLFLDRLRERRDDDRFERGGEQLLRLDYMKERKAWEQRLRSEQQMDEMLLEEEEDDSKMQEDGPPEEYVDIGDLSPTEDQEIEELIGFLEPGSQVRDDYYSDDDYDALFMEVLSQEALGQDGISGSGQNLAGLDDMQMDM